MFFGSYLPHIFWHETTKRKLHNEVIYGASWNPKTMSWNQPKLKSEPGQTICLLFLDSDPNSYNNGLPVIASIKLTETTTLPEIFEFASNPNHKFDGTQKALLMKALLDRTTSASSEYQYLNKLWSYHADVTIDASHSLPSHP
jgi:hypothetical protein